MFHRFISYLVMAVWLGIVILPGYAGWEYYRAPLQERAFMELHELLKPTGLAGHGYGMIGTLFLVVGVASYSLRKRVRALQNWGKLRNWLRFHIFLCTSGPFLILWHTSLKFNGLVAVSFWSMVIVVISGILGRYVYNRIPKTEDGYFQNIRFIEAEQEKLREEIQSYIVLEASQEAELGLQLNTLHFASPWKALANAVRFDITGLFRRKRDQVFLRDRNLSPEEELKLMSLIKSYRWKTRQQFLVEPLQKIFSYWHVFHIPLATVMFVILAVHVVVAVLFGYTWIL